MPGLVTPTNPRKTTQWPKTNAAKMKMVPLSYLSDQNLIFFIGRVTIGPKNMLASPIHPGHYNSTIWHTITPYPEYIGDVYDADRHAEYIKQKPWNIKYAEQNYFKGMSSGPYPLNKDRNVYGYPPALGPNKKTWSYKNKVGHDNPFKPSHPNHGGKMGTFTKFQRLIPDPSAIHKATRRPPPENPKDAFR